MTLARIRSPICTAPTSWFVASTTRTQVMPRNSISSTASTASASGRTVRGAVCITSRAVSGRRSPPFSIRRRKSPSVKMPSSAPLPSTTADAPSPLALISRIRALRATSGATCGKSAPLRITSLTWVSSLRPSAPPGCERAKSSALKPRASSSATASASPKASCAVVLAVGARLSGQASLSTLLSSVTPECRASVDCRPPVMATSGTPRRLSTGRMAVSSSLSPLLEIASTTSAAVIMPRSPWLASAGCTKMAGVPVDASVAAILRPMWPLLPMPITTTRPLHSSICCTACAKGAPVRALRPSTAAASMSKVSCASRTACAASNGGVREGGDVIQARFYRPTRPESCLYPGPPVVA